MSEVDDMLARLSDVSLTADGEPDDHDALDFDAAPGTEPAVAARVDI